MLKPQGLLAFTFQHARQEAWLAVASAIEQAGLTVVAAHPVKAEMSLSVPKQQAKEPINLDLIIVCKRAVSMVEDRPISSHPSIPTITGEATTAVARYNQMGTKLSRGDIRVILMGGFLKAHSVAWQGQTETWTSTLLEQVTEQIEAIYSAQEVATKYEVSPEQTLLLLERRSNRLEYIEK